MKSFFLLLVTSLITVSVWAQDHSKAVNLVLDDIHKMASEANFEGYFNLYTDDAIFLGTDATERWTIEEFKGYAKPSFDRGRGWTYTPTERHVFVSPDGKSAWFDERLQNEGYGECRGTGILLNVNGTWKVAQYNLTVPIPNDLLRNVVGQIREHLGLN